MDIPTSRMKKLATSQPQTIAAGPPFGSESARTDAIDGSSPMMLNAIPNVYEYGLGE